MTARMKSPAAVLPAVLQPMQALYAAAHTGGVPAATMALVHLRASQINGCSFCVEYTVKGAKKAGETDERLFAVSAWREAPYFTDSERAALALAESMTRLSDSTDPVSDAVWNEAARHFDEQGLASLVVWIATSNLYNRVNVATRQPAGKASWDR
jgi:AhpD family alkylhydroperoxidase